ncbi:MAG: magnesium transporter [Clostridia bacterium]|nr:magnesium transporter [Clostridia bacterium]
MEFNLTVDQINDLIEKNEWGILRNYLAEANPVDIALLLEELDNDKMLLVFRILPKDISADVFSYMEDTEQQAHVVESISNHEVRALIDDLFLDDTVDFLEEMPANVVTKVLRNTNETTRKLINQFLKYPDNSAGSLMTIEFIQFRLGWTVRRAMDHLRANATDSEMISTCFVVDERRHLQGIVELRQLILAEDDAIIDNIMEDTPLCVNTLDDQEYVASQTQKYDLTSVPVTDKEGRLVGIITIDDVVDVIEEENTEDFEKMAAMQPSEEEYLKTGVFSMAKNRIVWLLVLMLSATFTGRIIQHYNDLLQSAIVLAAYYPMLMNTGGNCGSQASTMVIRGMALGEIEWRDIFRVQWKELRVGFVCALVLSAVNFLRILIFEPAGATIAFVVSISLFATVILSKFIGCTMPLLAKKVRLDPALMASPLITTIVDACSLALYFFIATKLLAL